MIAFLSGQPIIEGKSLIILVNGVGYGVVVGSLSMAKLAPLSQVDLYIYTHVREDKLELYGFTTQLEKEMFLLLIDVSGVGPKTGQNIVDGRAQEVVAAVQNANTAFFSSVPRVGKKLAQKIIIELRGKLGELKTLSLGPSTIKEQQISEALISLGFNEQLIAESMQELAVEDMELEAAIKETIKLLSKK
jgi:Holliday junction DNA helicase RuvA